LRRACGFEMVRLSGLCWRFQASGEISGGFQFSIMNY
jgi:hypothetical protein